MLKTMAPLASQIEYFYKAVTRGQNDSANKIREHVLAHALAPPAGYCEDPVYGERWRTLNTAFDGYLRGLCPGASRTAIQPKAGRGHHHDMVVSFYDSGDALLAEIPVEFKYGGVRIDGLPQFLSLPVKSDILPCQKYSEFYYDRYLDAYLATDPGITATKPSKAEYLTRVCGINYECHPLFAQLYAREETSKRAKAAIVNVSIRDYLETHGKEIDLVRLSELFKATQVNKHYALWSPATARFHHDIISDADMSDLSFKGIKNNNVLVVASPTCEFHLLLRWRNHKGVLMPCWQIKMKRRVS